jgi:hypothetical protein
MERLEGVGYEPAIAPAPNAEERYTEVTPRALARFRAMIGSAATAPVIDFADMVTIAERIADPVALLERRIATATLDELQALYEALERVGVRMVERAAEIRRTLVSP